jgi:hypothetical protein
VGGHSPKVAGSIVSTKSAFSAGVRLKKTARVCQEPLEKLDGNTVVTKRSNGPQSRVVVSEDLGDGFTGRID